MKDPNKYFIFHSSEKIFYEEIKVRLDVLAIKNLSRNVHFMFQKFSSQVKSFNPFAPDAAESVQASNSSTTNTTAPSKPSVMDPFDDLLGLSADTSTTSAPATQTSPFGNPPNAASSDPFGGSSVQPTSANTFDPFAAFNATPQQQNVQNSNPFLQSVSNNNAV